jgi:hypothetical protein
MSLRLVHVQKQNFTRSFAMESVRRILLWRLHHLLPLLPAPSPRTLRLLPSTSRDPFGHPIIVMNNFAAVDRSEDAPPDFKKAVAPTLERLRKYLKELNENDKSEGRPHRPVLQYVLFLDLEGVLIQHIVSLLDSLLTFPFIDPSAECGSHGVDHPRGSTSVSGDAGSWCVTQY